MNVVVKGSGKFVVYYEQGNTIYRTRYNTLTRAGLAARKLSREKGFAVTVMKNGIELPPCIKFN